MPELPEVETVKAGLEPYLLGETITDVYISNKKMRRSPERDVAQLIKNTKITKLSRRSKYLYIHLNNGKTIIIHLGMSGSFTLKENGTKPEKHDHFIIYLNKIQVHLYDPRRFGFYDIQKTEHLEHVEYIKNLGPEPFSNEFSYEYLYSQASKSKKPVKTLIMDNNVVVGIGNIYACEALYSTNLHPLKPSHDIDRSTIKLLRKNIMRTLNSAILAGGSSLKDHKQADGTLGYFQHNFLVYGRDGQSCQKCGSIIERILVSGRGTFLCPNCQKI